MLCRSSVLVPNTGTAESAGMWPMASTWCLLGIGQWPTGNHKEEPTSHSSNSPGSQKQEYWYAVEGYCGSSSEHWWVYTSWQRVCALSKVSQWLLLHVKFLVHACMFACLRPAIICTCTRNTSAVADSGKMKKGVPNYECAVQTVKFTHSTVFLVPNHGPDTVNTRPS